MLRLFVKNNTNGYIHEYGTNKHDALILQDDGSLHYENMQCCAGTKYQEEGYSFCKEDGTIPEWDLEHGVEPYLDISGEFYAKPKTNADRIRAMSDQELANWLARTQYENMMEAAEIFGTQLPFEEETLKGSEQECLQWLKQPAEVDNG